ncbi:hypothetical protein FALBO_10993 [Fusarium albosuccineum]|uniref:DUF6594 domain-containing protein n=1 Tax=Fusarium albosuccineum TaxID=1237068 RepID=A0A8H4L6Q0_9HYPO|nr:hypothetical protein FALBO_10993 [Fusarium albosuccineum]
MADPLSLAASLAGLISLANALNGILSKRSGSFLVQSFHTQQAKRIDEIQDQLIRLFQEKEPASPHASSETRAIENINQDIDKTLSQEAIPDQLLNPSKASMLFNFVFDHWKYQQSKEILEIKKTLRSSSRYVGENMFLELNRDVRLKKERQDAYLERLWMGAFGGIALIGPMILMTLRQDKNTSLITASVATTIFVLVLTVAGRGLGGKDVLAATAAYAAVLVVFVGTSIQG